MRHQNCYRWGFMENVETAHRQRHNISIHYQSATTLLWLGTEIRIHDLLFRGVIDPLRTSILRLLFIR